MTNNKCGDVIMQPDQNINVIVQLDDNTNISSQMIISNVKENIMFSQVLTSTFLPSK
jgi:hypothetical protein